MLLLDSMRIKIKDKEYDIPSYINIENYVKLFNIKDFFDDDYFEIKLISIVTGAKSDDIMVMNHSTIKNVANHIMSILPTTKFVFEDSFEIDGVEYGFIPEYKNMTFAEFVDLDTMLTKKPDEIMNNLHIIAAMMFRPIKSKKSKHNYKIEEYNPDTIDERAELFKKKLDVKYVLGGKFFFSKSAKTPLISSQPSSIRKKLSTWLITLKLYWRLRKILHSKKLLDGSLSSTELVETILQSTKQSSKKEH